MKLSVEVSDDDKRRLWEKVRLMGSAEIWIRTLFLGICGNGGLHDAAPSPLLG